MLVVLDATALISDYLMRKAAFEIIWRHGTDLKIRLAVPEAAYEDAVFHLNKEYQDAHSSLQKSIRTIERASVDGIDMDCIPEMDPENPQKYRRFLLAHIEMMGEIVRPSEEVLRRVSERCHARRRPFSGEGDAGYKDALVWETVLDLLRTTDERVLFVTADLHFLDQSKTRLHKHLVADLEEAGCTRRVRLFTSLSDLTNNRLLAKARRDRKLEQAYLNLGNPIFSIPDFLNSHAVKGMLQPVDLNPKDCQLPKACTLVSLREFQNWEVKPEIEVRSLGGRKKLCIFEASAECVVHWRKPDPKPQRMITTDEQDRLIAVENLPNRSVLWGKALRKCRFRMELVIDYGMKRWVSWSDELVECIDPSTVNKPM
jgi:hypothetical protein